MAGCADALLRLFCMPVLVRLLVLLQMQLLVMVALQLEALLLEMGDGCLGWACLRWGSLGWGCLGWGWPGRLPGSAGWGAAALGVFSMARKCQLEMMTSMAWT